MTPDRLLRYGIRPALAELAGRGILDTFEARRFLLAIALQESRIEHRRQVTASGLENGPAASFWQFEIGGGCTGVLRHPAVMLRMREICTEYNVAPTPAGLWEAMRYNDIVAAAAARLLVYTLPGALPTHGIDGWAQYIEAWRPGKPHPETWVQSWNLATRVVDEYKERMA